MATQDIQIQILEGAHGVHKASSTLSPKFSDVGVGSFDLHDNGSGGLDMGGAALIDTALTPGLLLLGNAGGVAVPVALSGDVTIDHTGSVTIANGVVTSPKLSAGLQNELVDHEDRITTAEGEIATLELAVAAIQANTGSQQVIAGNDGTVYGTTLTFSADNTVLDLEVWIDGRLQTPDTTGSGLQAYQKTSTTEITFTEAVPSGKQILVFKRGTSSGPSVTGAVVTVDLTSITVDPRPSINGAQSLGVGTRAWGSLFLKDTVTAQVYQMVITNGVLDFLLV